MDDSVKKQFYAGQVGSYDGIEYRILEGNRKPGDLVLEFRLPGSDWHRPKMSHTFILTALKYQVEENNYPPILGYLGGAKFWQAIKRACISSWRQEAEAVALEANAAKKRRQETNSSWDKMWSKQFDKPELVWGEKEEN